MREPWWPTAVTYRADLNALVVHLRSQATINLPVQLFPELRRVTPKQLGEVELTGEALRWDELDLDISFVGCLEKAFGAQFFARVAGRMSGRVSTRKKAAAARANGAKGGRPRKSRS